MGKWFSLRAHQKRLQEATSHSRQMTGVACLKDDLTPATTDRATGENHAATHHLTRLRYSPVRVSISILSPISTNSGTGSSKPVEILAGFMTLPEVSPLTPGSV